MSTSWCRYEAVDSENEAGSGEESDAVSVTDILLA